jgi:hypothetical protein
MNKTVLTYSWLMKRTMALFKKDPAEYRALLGGASEKMVRGLRVRMDGPWSCNPVFSIHPSGKGERYASLTCHMIDGKFYTGYHLHFTTTQYRKRMDKYLPITLPEGVRSRVNDKGNVTKCIVHNADGSVYCESQFTGGRVRRPGDCSKRLFICDNTGMFAGDDPKTNLIGEAPYSSVNSRTAYGWFPGASRNRNEWLESIKAIPAGMCDHKKMLTVAAKAYLTVARLVQKYPHLRMAMFPADVATDSSWQQYRAGTDITKRTVMYRSADGTPTLYNLPEVVLYWMEPHNESAQVGAPRLSITIPPHGNPLMNPVGRAAPCSRTARDQAQARRRFDDIDIPMGWEQPYHSLLAWKPGVKFSGEPSRSHRVIQFGQKDEHLDAEQQQAVVIWSQHEDKALVRFECDELDVPDCPFPMDTPIAMRPEDVGLRFEEKFLMESLPLC